MTKLEKKIAAMKVEVSDTVNKMTVVEMRKAAVEYGIKNAKKYRRVELANKLCNQMVAVKESSIRAEAENAEKEKRAAKAKDTNKRYKADKIANGDVAKLAGTIMNATHDEVKAMDLFNVNRKVLIEVMKQLHCTKWYRTYDKPTMVAKITAALFGNNNQVATA